MSYFNDSVLQALDYVIAQAKLNGVRLLLCLVNNWHNYGGKAKYVSWGQLGGEDVSCDDDFYTSSKCREYYKAHVKVQDLPFNLAGSHSSVFPTVQHLTEEMLDVNSSFSL